MRKLHSFYISLFLSGSLCFGQVDGPPQLKSIDEVIQGIDSLLEDLDQGTDNQSSSRDSLFGSEADNKDAPIDRSFRVGNELMPGNLLNEEVTNFPANTQSVNEDDLGEILGTDQVQAPMLPVPTEPASRNSMRKVTTLPSLDYGTATLEDLLREVDLLELPEFQVPMQTPVEASVSPLTSPSSVRPAEVIDRGDIVNTPILSTPAPIVEALEDIDPYIVLGDQIDEELKEKIREAIMETRMASGGSGESICHAFSPQGYRLLQSGTWQA